MANSAWKEEYKMELERARIARSEGNEGMARVCARRAAGVVIGEYLQRRGYLGLKDNAYDRLVMFTRLPEVDELYKEIINHFLTRVNPDHILPSNADLIREVIWLKNKLISDGVD